jgi:N-acetylglucosaminyl-diphospho-decaprenol L-rhamnosyltransferase
VSGAGTARPLDAVVVNYNAAAHLAPCLTSLRSAGATSVVVVDNGSSDGSREVVSGADPAATWIETGANLGYGRAANRGAAGLHAEYLLVANPDLVVGPEALTALASRLDAEPDLGIVGPRILNPDGTIYPSARTFPDMVDAIGHGLLGSVAPANPFTRRYRLLDWDHSEPARVDWVSGACFLVRRTVWDRLAGFDPAYFMYLEDVDLCWRCRRAGWAVGYEPAAEVVHVQGVSANQHPYRMLAAHHRSMWRFAQRTTAGPKRAALPLVAVGLAARLVLSCAQHRLQTGRSVPAVPAQ